MTQPIDGLNIEHAHFYRTSICAVCHQGLERGWVMDDRLNQSIKIELVYRLVGKMIDALSGKTGKYLKGGDLVLLCPVSGHPITRISWTRGAYW